MLVLSRPLLPPTTTITLEHGRYLLRPQSPVVTVAASEDDNTVRAVIVICILERMPEVSPDLLTTTLTNRIVQEIMEFQRRDDVFSADFLSETMLLQSDVSLEHILPILAKEVRESKVLKRYAWDLRSIKTTPLAVDGVGLPSGPYFVHRGHVYEAWKLYPDPLSSFQTTVLPDLKDPYSFHILEAVSPDGYWKAVAVPSRLYCLPTDSRPLGGVRIAVKDLFHLCGIKSALNVRSFLETYGPDKKTAEYVKKLIDLGAVIVGKTKMTAFAGGERAPEFWIDFHCPFNPRADGYQTPSGSTSGGAACLAGYEWLDYSLGSDTYGSIRWPAASNGVYGLRCTVDEAASLEGVYAQCPLFDTMGLLGRDLPNFYEMARHSLAPTLKIVDKFPKRILCPTDWSANYDPFHLEVVNSFVSALEALLKVERTTFCINDVWQKNSPPQAKGKSFQEFFYKTGYNIFYYDAFHEWDAFRAKYERRFGKQVYVGPHVNWLWALGAAITTAEREHARTELDVYRKWFADHIIREDPDTVSSAIMVLPVGSTKPDYRDVLSGPFQARLGVDELTMGSWLGIPELVLPVDQIRYFSKATGRKERLPVSVTILGAKGSDLMLIKTALAALQKAGRPTGLLTGRHIFGDESGPAVAVDSGWIW